MGFGGDPFNNTETTSGAVYVFTRSASQWSQQAYVKASNTGEGDLFGGSVALSSDGDTLAVGAIGEASAAAEVNGDQFDNTSPAAGAAYVFARTGGLWSRTGVS